MRGIFVLMGGLALGTLLGCEDKTPAPAQPAPVQQPAAQQAPVPAPAAPVEMIQKKADVGMGEKGRGYGGEGMVSTPIKSLWAVKERLALVQVESAMQSYKALDPDGRAPKSHQEFMDKIIKENNIKLPELPEGHRYVYDPVKQELMVEEPKQP